MSVPSAWSLGHDNQTLRADVADWPEARAELLGVIREHAANLRSWSDPGHDCDDILCPSYGESCWWQRGGELEGLADHLETQAAPDQPWDGTHEDTTYWIRPVEAAPPPAG